MNQHILLDEFHLSVYVPRGRAEREYAAIRRILNSRRFQKDLRDASRAVFRDRQLLSRVRLTISR